MFTNTNSSNSQFSVSVVNMAKCIYVQWLPTESKVTLIYMVLFNAFNNDNADESDIDHVMKTLPEIGLMFTAFVLMKFECIFFSDHGSVCRNMFFTTF